MEDEGKKERKRPRTRLGVSVATRWYKSECNVFREGCVCANLLQSCRTLCDAMDCSPPGPPVQGISQARILEWVAISYARGSS